ncbi:MAG: hypothetical protein DSM106950_35545 [Stigonema ocellatum SAG 48.90 = DSM 106950]|nr:hypothetical protein [Stigonema ocellatum SAG 48.90 = DSM 106950]
MPRKLLHLGSVKTFRELTADPKLAKKIESVYKGKIDAQTRTRTQTNQEWVCPLVVCRRVLTIRNL